MLSRRDCQARLKRLFSPDVVDDRVVAGRLAASAVFVFLYCDAVDGRVRLRPSAVLWMDDAAARRTSAANRAAWCAAAGRSHAAVRELLAGWKVEHRPWYAENSRETLRDEVFRGWQRLGAIRRDEAIPTTSSKPAWTLAPEFAALFDPALTGTALRAAIEEWQSAHLGPVGLARQALERRRSQAGEAVRVTLPDGRERSLRPGDSSLILKGVVEVLAPRLLVS